MRRGVRTHGRRRGRGGFGLDGRLRGGAGLGQGDAVGGVDIDAEHVADGVEEAPGLGRGLEELLKFRRGGDPVAQQAAGAGGGLDVLDEPHAAAGQADRRALAGLAGAGGPGGAGPGQGAGLPTGIEPRETLGDAPDIVPDEAEIGETGLGRVRKGGDGGPEAGEDERKALCQARHGGDIAPLIMLVNDYWCFFNWRWVYRGGVSRGLA